MLPSLIKIMLGTILLLVLCYSTNLQAQSIFRKSNLTAWCVVPFDARERNSEQRAQMLKELGITKLAYDWREKHIPTFDEELAALKKHKITLQAFWLASSLNPENEKGVQEVFDFLERNKVKTEIWLLLHLDEKEFEPLSQTKKIQKVAPAIRYITDRAAKLGCKVGLYNHGGWFGEPENQLQIIQYIKSSALGMIYNFHHARMHHKRFKEFYPQIMPHLLSINIAGLKQGDTDKFYRTGEGDVEVNMIRLIAQSEYKGSIGIINHDEEEDAEVGLQLEMNGLRQILKEIGDEKTLRTFRE